MSDALARMRRSRYRAVVQATVMNIRKGMGPEEARRDAITRIFASLTSDKAKDAKAREILRDRNAQAALKDLGIDDVTIQALKR